MRFSYKRIRYPYLGIDGDTDRLTIGQLIDLNKLQEDIFVHLQWKIVYQVRFLHHTDSSHYRCSISFRT